jgi:AraC family transcriptional regulator
MQYEPAILVVCIQSAIHMPTSPSTSIKPYAGAGERFSDVLERTHGITINRQAELANGRIASTLTCSVSANELSSPALPELVILATHDYQLSSALMDFGWGFRQHFSSAPHPIHVFPPGASFSWILDGPARATLLTLDAAQIFGMFEELGVADPLDGLWMLCQRGFPEPYVYATINALTELIQRGTCPRLLVDGYIATIAFHLSKRWTSRSEHTSRVGRLSTEVLCQTIEYMNDHIADDISLDDLAKLSDMTKYHFLRRFKASTNETPYQYLRNRRIERARHLLVTTQHSVSDIAGLCGFGSATGFSEVFRKTVGIPPTVWRAEQRT